MLAGVPLFAMLMIMFIPLAFATDYTLMTAFTPKTNTIDGLLANEGTTGQQLVVTTTVRSNLNEARSYAAIIEVRDSDGVTIALNWQVGDIDAHGSTIMGMSWTPQKADTYQMRTFVVSGIEDPHVYSAVASSEIKIS